MKEIPNLRPFFSPVQPSVRQAGQVIYREFLPDIKLQPYIYCYWHLKSPQPLTEPFSYSVVADGCMDIFFDQNNPEENFVMGFCENHTEFPLENLFSYFGIRFFPAAFPELFRISALELQNSTEYLSQVSPDTSRFIAGNFHERQTAPQIVSTLNAYFSKAFSNATFQADPRLYEAINIILRKSGVVNIETDLDTGVSPRHLRRLFEKHIGATAKSFCKVVRFQQILKSVSSGQDLKKNKLFFDYGYYDQSHFIKEFKSLYGLSPFRALRK